ncbi:MAG: CAP domain-containing protein [Gemmataceae bacterium]
MIRFQCPGCQTVLQVGPTMAGKLVACARCQQRLRVPGAVQSQVAPPPPVVLSGEQTLTRRRSSPRSRPKTRSPWPWVAVVAGVIIIGAGTGLAVYLHGNQPHSPVAQVEKSEASRTDEPTKISPTPERPTPPEENPRPIDPEPTPPAPSAPDPVQDLRAGILGLINRQRASEGVPALALHQDHSRGCQEHAEYLRDQADDVLIDSHDQDTRHPRHTMAGLQAARVATLARGDLRATLRQWLIAPGHRSLLLAPSLESLGLGLTRGPDDRWIGVFDFIRGNKIPGSRPGEAVLYPAPGQGQVSLYFPGNEVPDPLPNVKDKLAGYPITVTFPPRRKVSSARGMLEDERGESVPLWLSSPARPANEKYPRTQQNTVCLMSRTPLLPGQRYVVRVEVDDDWARTWSFTTQSPREAGRRIHERAIEQINVYRQAAALGPITLDPALSVGSQAHARYLALHLDRTEGFRPDTQVEGQAGFSPEGKAASARAMVRLGGGSGPIDATDWIMASVLNRHLALNPSMKSMGIGTALQAPRGWIWVFNPTTSRRRGDGPTAILYPGKNQTHIPIFYGREIASMVAGQSREAAAGYPITANFFPTLRVSDSQAALRDAAGDEVQCWVSTPEKPLPGTGTYRQIMLLPRAPLKPGVTYTASMSASVEEQPWAEEWSFTTLDHAKFRQATAESLLSQLNRIRALAGLEPVTLDEKLSEACQKHAAYVVKNVDHPKVQGLGIHDEDNSLPGYTPEGAEAGPASVIAIISDPGDSVENWMATLYHRIPLLDPRVKRIGYGQAQHPQRGWVTVLDSSRGR